MAKKALNVFDYMQERNGDKKHGTKHNEYVCYNEKCPNYNKVVDRDKNAMLSLLALTEYPELNHAL